MRKWGWLLVVCGLSALAIDAQAQARPNFTGQWMLNTSQSFDSTGKPLPFAAYILTLVHREPSLYILQGVLVRGFENGNQLRLQLKIGDPARPVVRNSLATPHFADMKASAWWEGNILAFAFQSKKEGKDVRMVRKMTMAAGGRRIDADTTFMTSDGRHLLGSPMTEVWEKQP